METWVVILIMVIAAILLVAIVFGTHISKLRKAKKYERGLKMRPLLIHLPPTTDDIEGGSRDERDVATEAVSKAQVMYSILSSVAAKGTKAKIYGQPHFSLEIIAKDGFTKYYAIVPAELSETVKQAIQSAYPSARLEEKREETSSGVGAASTLLPGPNLP